MSLRFCPKSVARGCGPWVRAIRKQAAGSPTHAPWPLPSRPPPRPRPRGERGAQSRPRLPSRPRITLPPSPVASPSGFYLAAIGVPQAQGPAVGAAWSKVPAGWFGDLWSLQLAIAPHLAEGSAPLPGKVRACSPASAPSNCETSIQPGATRTRRVCLRFGTWNRRRHRDRHHHGRAGVCGRCGCPAASRRAAVGPCPGRTDGLRHHRGTPAVCSPARCAGGSCNVRATPFSPPKT